MDGDAKINFKEFELGMKSTLNVFGEVPRKKKRPKSGVNVNNNRLVSTTAKSSMKNQMGHTPRKSSACGTPRIKSAGQTRRARIASSKSQTRKRNQKAMYPKA